MSDDICEALMRSVIRNLREAVADAQNYTARSNLMWDAAMAENRIIKLGKQTDFQCHQMEHQLGAFTNCNHGEGLAVLHPVYYRHIYKSSLTKFRKFAVDVWGIASEGRSEEELAGAGVAAFMMSSVLLNPQLLLYSTALGPAAMAVRLISCTICGIAAGFLVYLAYGKKPFFDFTGFEPRAGRDTDPNLLLRFLKNLGRNIKATAPYFLIGVLLSALFQRYVPADGFAALFGRQNEGFGVLMAATIGVPLYACGGGTIPLLQQWLVSGMSMGSAAAFMITGPATKITNLGALKIVMGIRRFILYLVFVMAFSLATGLLTNLVV